MDVRILEYLMMIEKEMSISKAAERVHISQSALSQNLAKVEREVGSPLFVRVNRQLKPTRIGRIYLDGAREMVAIKKDVYTRIGALTATGNQVLRLAIDPQVYALLLHKVLPLLKAEYPDVNIQLLSADTLAIRQYLAGQIVDGGFLCSKENLSSMLIMRPLYTEQLLIAYPKERTGNSIPFIYPQENTYFRPICQRILAEMKMTPTSYYEAGDFDKQRQLVEQNYGFTFLPKRLALAGGEFDVQPLERPYEYTVYFAVPKYAESSPMLERFYELARAAL